MIELDEIFGPRGRLASHMEDYEPRQGQYEMAKAIEKLLGDSSTNDFENVSSDILVVEAETGIGKTLAYLIPALLSGHKMVVSTATLNLQDQILDKDIPLVEKLLGEDVRALCVKGRENYLCLYRWYQYRSNPQLSILEDPSIEKIDRWLSHTPFGDRSELSWLGEKSVLWQQISARSTNCLGGECPETAGCFITRLRKKAGAAGLVIVNHHLFFSDLMLRKGGYGEVLPRYESVIFDEAHHLENVASVFFGKSFSGYQLIDWLSDIERQAILDLPPDLIDRLLPENSGLKKRWAHFASIFPSQTGRFHLDPFIEELSNEVWTESVQLLIDGIVRSISNLEDVSQFGENWSVYIKRGEEFVERLRELALTGEESDHKMVRWYERRERTVVISATPIEVAELLNEYLYNSIASCVLCSATLSSGGSFSYIKNRLGLSAKTQCLQFASPFNYEKKAIIYIPENTFPMPTDEGFAAELALRMLEIVNLTKGRALILCTSIKSMEYLATYLESKLEFLLLVQGRKSRNALLQEFRETTSSVLLAVASFWEGVDVVGESLSCVIIDKIPFEVPSDPVVQARIEHIKEEGGNPFFSFQVPRAILTLRQGVGRLMRSTSDGGVVAIMDTRLFQKGYGKTFLKSLPPAPIVRSIKEIETFID